MTELVIGIVVATVVVLVFVQTVRRMRAGDGAVLGDGNGGDGNGGDGNGGDGGGGD